MTDSAVKEVELDVPEDKSEASEKVPGASDPTKPFDSAAAAKEQLDKLDPVKVGEKPQEKKPEENPAGNRAEKKFNVTESVLRQKELTENGSWPLIRSMMNFGVEFGTNADVDNFVATVNKEAEAEPGQKLTNAQIRDVLVNSQNELILEFVMKAAKLDAAAKNQQFDGAQLRDNPAYRIATLETYFRTNLQELTTKTFQEEIQNDAEFQEALKKLPPEQQQAFIAEEMKQRKDTWLKELDGTKLNDLKDPEKSEAVKADLTEKLDKVSKGDPLNVAFVNWIENFVRTQIEGIADIDFQTVLNLFLSEGAHESMASHRFTENKESGGERLTKEEFQAWMKETVAKGDEKNLVMAYGRFFNHLEYQLEQIDPGMKALLESDNKAAWTKDEGITEAEVASKADALYRALDRMRDKASGLVGNALKKLGENNNRNQLSTTEMQELAAKFSGSGRYMSTEVLALFGEIGKDTTGKDVKMVIGMK